MIFAQTKVIVIAMSIIISDIAGIPGNKPASQHENWKDIYSQDTLIEEDNERMDIFDTIIRTIINSSELNFTDAILLLRDWESIIRKQLANATSPGHLFSPVELPDDF